MNFFSGISGGKHGGSERNISLYLQPTATSNDRVDSMLAYFFFFQRHHRQRGWGAARDEWLNIQRHCFSSRLAREFFSTGHGGKISLRFFHSAKNWRDPSLVRAQRLRRGELFLDLAICCLRINPNYFRGGKKKYITKHRIRQSAIPQSMTLSHVCERQPLCYRRGWGSKQRSAMIATSELISQLPLCRCSR